MVRNGRQFVVFLILVTFAGLLGARLYYWQVVRHDFLAQLAQNEHVRDEQIPARRGSIYDAAGNVLATTESVDAVYAAREQITEDPRKVAQTLSPLLQIPEDTIYQRITDRNLKFVRLKPWVTPAVSQQIRDTKLRGIFLEPTTHRRYPQAGLAAQVLGFVNDDSLGQYGLEEAYNSVLAGHPGHLTAEFDAAGQPIDFTTPRDSLPAQNGADLLTSIDSALQYIAEQALADAVKKHHATGGTILIMNPKTGEILADANVPSFDPNNYAGTNDVAFANPTISKIYEPGSTFKIVTMAIALAEHTVTPTTTVPDSGSLFLGGIHITNWDGKGHSPENMVQLLQYSSNVGAATVAWRVGPQRYYPYIRDFGFGQKTGVDLAGEVPGEVVFPTDQGWSAANMVTNAFGQGIAVTPLQLVTAAAAVANHGLLMKPHVVTAIRDGAGVHPIAPTEARQVLPPDVAATLTQMLVESAKIGEAQLAVVPGFKVAAKTGTAQVASPKGGYAEGKFVASLLGFAPADDPQFVMLVKIDEPQGVPFGAEVAAPVWRDIATQLFAHFRIEPSDPAALQRSAIKPIAPPAAASKETRREPPASPRARATPAPSAAKSVPTKSPATSIPAKSPAKPVPTKAAR